MLAGAGVFREEANGRFALTPLGECLGSEGPESVRDGALYLGSPQMWEVVGRLRDTVRTGEPTFPRRHGMSLWHYVTEHPDFGAPFDRWMSRRSDQHNAAVVAAYDFSPFRQTFDVLMLLQHPGAGVRTAGEYAALFAAAGLRPGRIIPTASPNSILEGTHA
jgi:hypothetical protein